ncbi:hypothetical protein AZE42_06675 [Rhizopogon vesiculosus]|uniref:C2H2-type domain-containing protein n=1 Tax=Rhizopogon vesiculosus TaxID=180088 RepID=A0A1J8QFB8_9AGAM|nr:hypothetical protein AZE42_06675 [Rhizopogon vesiculosus]
MPHQSVLLPSIRDIFPEISIRTHPSSQDPDLSPASHDQIYCEANARNRIQNPHRSGDSASPATHCLPSPPPSSSSSESAPNRHLSYRMPQGPDGLASPPATYSFNVLRADPVTSSLEHVTSSTKLRSRGTSSSQGNPGAGIANGSTPAFRVSMTVVSPRQSQQRHKHRSPDAVYGSQSPRDSGFTAAASPTQHVQETRSQPSSSVLSFSVSDPPNSASTVMTNDGRRPYLKSSDPLSTMLHGEGRGKKHQCPHCGKRFNRPSSMKIHVNTHTGAKPYQCPFPGCGREFNVNSNMRRHWRNHTRLSAAHLSDMDRGDQSPFPPDMLGHGQSLASPPATDDSEESDDDISDDDSHYAMDIDVYEGCGKEHKEVNPHQHHQHHRGGSGSQRNSESFWSRSPSPVRKPAAYSYPRPRPPSSLGRSPSRATEYLYRPSNPAYARSCTDSRVSTALRPAFPCDTSGRAVVR